MNKPIDCIRALSRDMVANSGSGHIGMSLSASSMVYALYRNILNVSPKNPDFYNRDRVVFSAGHCTPLIYSILHMFGYDITTEDLRKFRSLNSVTPGHPEVQTCGIDCTTGLLGQGIANAVGMAIAEKHLASKFNKPNFPIFDHYTYAIVGEGCLMEGVSYESMSLAGELNLNKLIVLYDCNKVTIDSNVNGVFTENLEERVRAQGWNVFKVNTNDDIAGITKAITEAKQSTRPSFVIVPSIIGVGLDIQGQQKAHNARVDTEDAVSFREMNGLPRELFNIPREMYMHFQELQDKADKMEFLNSQMLKNYKKTYKKEYELFEKYLNNDFNYDVTLEDLNSSGRDVGHVVLNAINLKAPNILCGSADLVQPTKCFLDKCGIFSKDNPSGQNIRFGVREFAMSCICSGISLHGGVVPVCSTFLAFADYMKSSIRVSALMKAKSIYIFTHDSLKNGEDGATHQPIEQLDMLRSIPNLQVFRPCCADEIIYAFKKAFQTDGPTAIILTKNALPKISCYTEDMREGIYPIVHDINAVANVFASGEDITLSLQIRDIFLAKGYEVNVYSMLKVSSDIESDNSIPNCVIECGSGYSVQHLVGTCGMLVCTRKFGASGKGEELYASKGFEAKHIAMKLLNLCKLN